ncbi:hypothetical protein Y032_0037g3404 [Ancylostoma ceylanicum]|uniref:Uncharacterized protein n=1 Tax=Ancylostoma ceylanicum TaxID=53326 RepID=A0A016UK53_9BILA|nr:hypothetical protein Y032_0037g3404 [Ancylostoma ceylanicum]
MQPVNGGFIRLLDDKAHDLSLAFAAAFVPVIDMLYDTRWQCVLRSEIFSVCVNMWEDMFQKTAQATHRAISAFTSLPVAPASAQLCMRSLSERGASLPLGKVQDRNLAWHWATHSDCSKFRLEPVDQLMNRFHAEEPLVFLTHVKEFVDGSECEDIFNANLRHNGLMAAARCCLPPKEAEGSADAGVALTFAVDSGSSHSDRRSPPSPLSSTRLRSILIDDSDDNSGDKDRLILLRGD